jgi:hypothetical protein
MLWTVKNYQRCARPVVTKPVPELCVLGHRTLCSKCRGYLIRISLPR